MTGASRYDGSSYQYCNGTSWVTLQGTVDFQGATTAQTMTGSDVTIYTGAAALSSAPASAHQANKTTKP